MSDEAPRRRLVRGPARVLLAVLLLGLGYVAAYLVLAETHTTLGLMRRKEYAGSGFDRSYVRGPGDEVYILTTEDAPLIPTLFYPLERVEMWWRFTFD